MVRFIDGILPPKTIKAGVFVSAGNVFWVHGNYLALRPITRGELARLVKDPSHGPA